MSTGAGKGTAIVIMGEDETAVARLPDLDSLRSEIQAPTAGSGPPFGRRWEQEAGGSKRVGTAVRTAGSGDCAK